ncbi:unnamed protein product [Calypogeia fissa]
MQWSDRYFSGESVDNERPVCCRFADNLTGLAGPKAGWEGGRQTDRGTGRRTDGQTGRTARRVWSAIRQPAGVFFCEGCLFSRPFVTCDGQFSDRIRVCAAELGRASPAGRRIGVSC